MFFFVPLLVDVVVRDRDDWKQQCDDYAAAVAARETEEDEASLQQQIKRYKKELVQAHEVSERCHALVYWGHMVYCGHMLDCGGLLWTHGILWETCYIVDR